ncbi:MAG: GDP-mannose 4,6-dehydratase [Gammaproteobacteria bacterium]|nr:GDP-mannose 4,6-dehydratase [Gammaproteobacteria bacterium]
MTKKALITGITGQDGYYLTKLLLAKGYEVHGIKRRSSLMNTGRIDSIYEDPHSPNPSLFLHFGDHTDALPMVKLLQEVRPTEIYNLASQSHVRVSFDVPQYTTDANATGSLRLLEAIHCLGMDKDVKFYQASSSEMFGKVQEIPQTETTPFYPRSPYAAGKVFSYWVTINYRESYDMFTSNGILFNHESPMRGETFVTRKISMAVAAIKHGIQNKVYMGNLDAKRDWGHARDYVNGMWKMLQHSKPDDFVLATGRAESVRYFIEKAFACVDMDIVWEGKDMDEKGIDRKSGKVVVELDPRYFRPAEVDLLLGDPTKAQKDLGWKPETSLDELIAEMVESDLAIVEKLHRK